MAATGSAMHSWIPGSLSKGMDADDENLLAQLYWPSFPSLCCLSVGRSTTADVWNVANTWVIGVGFKLERSCSVVAPTQQQQNAVDFGCEVI